MKVALQPYDSVRASTYNPRTADPGRLDILELSLRKLGFVLPIYATPDGEIISGHQRHLVAGRIGAKQVPVVTTKPMELDERREVNIQFNRGTNDMSIGDSSASLTAALMAQEVHALAEALPDIEPDTPKFYRCLTAEQVTLRPFLADAKPNAHAKELARSLDLLYDVEMPIVISEDGSLVNGAGRVLYQADKHGAKGTIPAVRIAPQEVAFAKAMLNLLSMDFDIHTRYRDVLRWKAAFQRLNERSALPKAMVWKLHRGQNGAFDLKRNAALWKKHYGERCIDFGAGHLTATFMLREVGVDVDAFEPFHIPKNVKRRGFVGSADSAASRAIAREFLAGIGRGLPYSSIFLSAVFNEVPFLADIRHILNVVHALCTRHTEVNNKALPTGHLDWKIVNGYPLMSRDPKMTSFRVDYEPGIRMTKDKMQRYFSEAEMRALHDRNWKHIQSWETSNDVMVIASQPRPVNMDELEESVRFEFDVAYPDGETMGLGDEAWDVFRKRLAVTHHIVDNVAYPR